MSIHAGKRDGEIELYRMLLMVGICLMHTLQASGLGMSPLSHLMEGCVDGFVFISGWFGVKFSWNKLLRLYAVALWCAVVCTAGLAVNNHLNGVEFDVFRFIRSAWTQFGYYWFVHAYALMMVLAPYVNAAFERTKSIRFYLPFLVFSFGLSFAAIVPGLKGLIPLTPGLNPHAGLTLLGVYIVARLVRLHGLDEKVRTRWLL